MNYESSIKIYTLQIISIGKYGIITILLVINVKTPRWKKSLKKLNAPYAKRSLILKSVALIET